MRTLTYNEITDYLTFHGVELWLGYAVEHYTMDGIPGESFTRVDSLTSIATLRNYLGY